jgi:hypothetical protein
MGVRGKLMLVAAAVPTTVALLAIAAQLVGMVGIATSIAVHALIGLVIAAMLGALPFLNRSRHATRGPAVEPDVLVWLGIAIGFVGSLGAWIGGIGDFGLPPQGHDDIWHGYLVERLTHMPFVTAGTVAPVFADALTPTSFYQYGLHLTMAFAHSVVGVAVPDTLNSMWAIVLALAIATGGAALAWSLFPNRRWVAFWAASFAPAVVIFPYLTNGLLPYTASLAMAPGFLALLVAYANGLRSIPSWSPALAAVGIFVTHPSGSVATAIIATIICLEVAINQRRLGNALMTIRRLAIMGAIAVIAAAPWLFAAGERGPGRSPAFAQTDLASAISQVAVLGTPWTSPQPVLAILAVAGIIATIVLRRAIGLSAAYVILAALVAGTMAGLPSFAVLGTPWHAQWYRIVAALGVLVPVLAGLGVASLVWLVHERLSGRSARARALAIGIAVAIVATSSMGGAYAAAQGQSIVRTAWHSTHLIERSDVQLFAKLAEVTGPHDRVFNSPRDGSGWMYALYGVVPAHPYVYGTPEWSWDLVEGVGNFRDVRVACISLAADDLTYAVVKDVTVPGAEPYDIGGFVARHPELFVEIARTDSGVAYRIDQAALDECAGR